MEPLASDDEDDLPLSVIKDSQKSHDLQKNEQKKHKKKLLKILRANATKLIEVPEDGDCIFTAVSYFTQVSKTVIKEICYKHISQKIEHYQPFTSNLTTDHIAKMNKHWNTEMGDVVLLAIANITQSPIKVFSSKLLALDIRPTLSMAPAVHCNGNILLGHTAVPGREHYDVVGMYYRITLFEIQFDISK